MPFARRTLEAYEARDRKPTCNCAGYKRIHTAAAGKIIMDLKFSRLSALIGEEKVSRLSKKHVMIFGLGGVGGYAAEALARSGIGKLTLVDFDTVNVSNINRQLCATKSTVGKSKVEVTALRLLDINPAIEIIKIEKRYTSEMGEEFFSDRPDYIIDAIDSVTDKISLIVETKNRNIPIISAMGAGNKICAEKFKVSDISKTSVCPLAKVMRKELGLRGIKHLKVVFSDESPIVKERTPASAVWAVGAAGLLLGGEAIKDLIKEAD